MARLLLVRHGKTMWNQNGKYQGQTDVALSEEGKWQAAQLRQRLQGEKLAAVYASDLSRAYETARIVAEPHELHVKTFPALREINFGAWEGRTHQEIVAEFGDLVARWQKNPGQETIPRGESFTELMERSYRLVTDLVNSHPGETFLIVSHGGTIRSILCAALKLDLQTVWSFRQDNAAVNVIDFYGEKAILSLFNDTHHLQVVS